MKKIIHFACKYHKNSGKIYNWSGFAAPVIFLLVQCPSSRAEGEGSVGY